MGVNSNFNIGFFERGVFEIFSDGYLAYNFLHGANYVKTVDNRPIPGNLDSGDCLNDFYSSDPD